nr:CtsR family transcriptional regulator [bacterium]
MSALSDQIEQFIQAMLQGGEGHVELKRNELAQYFGCAPSQINYVLMTRFTPERGYLIRSRRGGGGYVRVVRIALDPDDMLMQLLTERVGNQISQQQAFHILENLAHTGLVTKREAVLMAAALKNGDLPLPEQIRDTLRAGQLKNMLLELIGLEGEKQEGGNQDDL